MQGDNVPLGQNLFQDCPGFDFSEIINMQLIVFYDFLQKETSLHPVDPKSVKAFKGGGCQIRKQRDIGFRQGKWMIGFKALVDPVPQIKKTVPLPARRGMKAQKAGQA